MKPGMPLLKLCVLGLAIFAVQCATPVKSSKTSESSPDCAIGPKSRPVLTLLSSVGIGGIGEATPIRSIFTGNIPPRFVLFSNRYAIFTRKGSSKKPFFDYHCARLSKTEYGSLIANLDPKTEMAELFGFFDSASRRRTPGYSELFWFKSKYVCTQFEMKGTTAEAAELSSRSRSSVAPKISPNLTSTIDKLIEYKSKQAKRWFPKIATLEFKQLDPSTQGAAKWPNAEFPISKLSSKKYRLDADKNMFYATTPIGLSKLRPLLTLLRKPVLVGKKIWKVGYRLSLPHEFYWAAPFPTQREEYSICNRYISRKNYFKLYGFSYL